MSEIALYNALTKLGLSPDEAKEAVADVASLKDVARNADLKDSMSEVKERLAKVETELKYLRWLFVVGLSITVAIIKYF